MPRRNDLKKILIIGSGPIVIGQACEFDYSGNQAVRALKEEGYHVVLHNPNPATVMTTPGNADSIYLEPLERNYLTDILKKEEPDAILPTMGGQNALNLVMSFDEEELRNKYGVELIGASLKSIRLAEDRGLFKNLIEDIGLQSPVSRFVRHEQEAWSVVEEVGFPVIIRPSFTLGGQGGSIAYSEYELSDKLQRALLLSHTRTALVEESLLGYQEFEFEVMRDKEDNALVVCAIENIDPMGIHTGDSITVAPIQTLSDAEYQILRTASIEILRAVGLECGGSNVQFAYKQSTQRLLVIEMNPRVSRSSALASKVTGFPIARSAAKLAVGYTLNEISNEITHASSSFFEPALDYCAVKMPKFELKKFPVHELGTEMRSIGESLAFGVNFCEAINKAIRSLEIGLDMIEALDLSDAELEHRIGTLHPARLQAIYTKLLREGEQCIEEICARSGYHQWVVYQIFRIAKMQGRLEKPGLADQSSKELAEHVQEAKRMGFTDKKIAQFLQKSTAEVLAIREKESIQRSYRCVDTCAAEFAAQTPYYYGGFSGKNEHSSNTAKAVLIVGSGPNRIGQGLEFDTCCTLAALAFQKRGYCVSIINNNPETVSTDYNVSDNLFFEPLSAEDLYDLLKEKGLREVLAQLGGQTPINIISELHSKGVEPIGTSMDSIDIAESRKRFLSLVEKLRNQAQVDIDPIPGAVVQDIAKVTETARAIGFPVLIRPSYVLGGQSMSVVYDQDALEKYIESNSPYLESSDLLIDSFLESAVEYDADLVSDGESVYIAGLLRHIEHAGVHSGDSACVFEPFVAQNAITEKIYRAGRALAQQLKIRGFLNIQFASVGEKLYILEANPRASRTVPFIAKTSGVDIIDMAVSVWTGERLADNPDFIERKLEGYDDLAVGCSTEGYAVKESVFSFDRFEGVDPALGPEMRSTGEAIGLGASFGEAFAKASMVASTRLPRSGTVFMSIAGKFKYRVLEHARYFNRQGFTIIATQGTAAEFQKHDIPCRTIARIFESGGKLPTILDEIREGRVDLMVNILKSVDSKSFTDDKEIRNAAVRYRIPYISTLPALDATLEGIEYLRKNEVTARKLHSRSKINFLAH